MRLWSVRTWLIRCVPFLVVLLLLQKSFGDDSPLGEGLKTIHIASVHQQEKTVGYLPLRVQTVDQQGNPTEKLEVIPAGPEAVFASGRVSVVADPRELAVLERRVQTRFGSAGRVFEVVPQSYRFWMISSGRVIEQTPESAGAPRNCAVQALIRRQKRGASVHIDFLGIVVYTEVVEPISATVKVQWSRIYSEIEKGERLSGSLSENRIEAIAERALAEGWATAVSEEPAGVGKLGARIISVLTETIIRTFLAQHVDIGGIASSADESGLPTAQPTDPARSMPHLSVSYSLRRDVTFASGIETVDLSVSANREGVVFLSGNLAIQF